MKGKTAMAEILTLMQKAPKHPGLRRFSICSIYVIRIIHPVLPFCSQIPPGILEEQTPGVRRVFNVPYRSCVPQQFP